MRAVLMRWILMVYIASVYHYIYVLYAYAYKYTIRTKLHKSHTKGPKTKWGNCPLSCTASSEKLDKGRLFSRYKLSSALKLFGIKRSDCSRGQRCWFFSELCTNSLGDDIAEQLELILWLLAYPKFFCMLLMMHGCIDGWGIWNPTVSLCSAPHYCMALYWFSHTHTPPTVPALIFFPQGFEILFSYSESVRGLLHKQLVCTHFQVCCATWLV